VEIKYIFELRPHQHLHLTEVGVEGGTTFIGKDLSVLLIDGQDEQKGEDIMRTVDGMLEMLNEEGDARSKQRSKQFSSAFRAHIKEFPSEYDLMDDPINERLIDRFKYLLKCELLPLLTGHVIEYDIRRSA
jgi:hypothetical protein